MATVLEDQDDGVSREIERHHHPQRPASGSFVLSSDLVVVFDTFGEPNNLPALGNINLSDDENYKQLRFRPFFDRHGLGSQFIPCCSGRPLFSNMYLPM